MMEIFRVEGHGCSGCFVSSDLEYSRFVGGNSNPIK